MLTAISLIAGLVVCASVVVFGLWHSSAPTQSMTQILCELEAAPKR